MFEPMRKRLRSLPSDSEIPPITKRDDEFWFEDGTLIIVAQDVEFRVYKGPLVKHSPVFRDMLTLPQPREAGPSVPVVRVHDHPVYFKHFLREFFAGNAMEFITHKPTFDNVCAVIQLGHKYEVDSLVQQALYYIKPFYPVGLDPWLALSVEHTSIHIFNPIHSIGIVNLARLTYTSSLLPAALMNCCMLDTKDLLMGFVREDGVRERLSPLDLTRVLVARTELTNINALAALRILSGHSEDCENSDEFACNECREAVTALAKPDCNWRFRPGISRSWGDFVVETGLEFCGPCMDAIRAQERKERLKIWQQMPELFGLTRGNGDGPSA